MNHTVERASTQQEIMPQLHADWLNPSEVDLRDSQLIDKEVMKRIRELEEVPSTIINTQLGKTIRVHQV